MTKLRTTLTIGVVVVAVIGAAACVYLVNNISGEAARAVLAVNAGVVVALAVTVYVLLGPTVKRLDDLVEALRALARGEKHARVEAADFAGLADVARAVNEVAASLCENDDPNLGPVQKRVREKTVETHKVRKSKSDPGSASEGSGAVAKNDSNHPEIGEVRVRKKDAPTPAQERQERQERREKSQKNERPPLIAGEDVSEPRPAKKRDEPKAEAPPAEAAPSTKPEPAAPSTKPAPAPTAEPTTAADVAAAPADGVADADAHGHAQEEEEEEDDDGNDTVIEAAEPQLPSRLELQALFSEFVKEKKAAGHEDVDVDFDAFQETILGECERLLAEHGCKGVRFEVAVGEGDVSLRPRLLR